MRLSNPIAIKSVSLVASWWLRLWLGSLSIRSRWLDPDCDPIRATRPFVYLFWHEAMLLPTHVLPGPRTDVLISTHRDGELIAQIVRMLRGGSVRGSTTRGGAAALLNMMRRGRAQHLAITPDGPRGPRRVMQPGAVYVAGRNAMPIVPCGIEMPNCWRAGSWDRMMLPRPFQQARWLGGRPIEIPPSLDRDGMEHYRQIVQTAMDQVQRRAEDAGDSVWAVS